MALLFRMSTPEGTAAERGLRNGDVILEVSGKKVATAGDLRSAIDAAQRSGKRSVLMQVKSGTAMKFVAVPISRG
jgi:serine protease Do